LEGGVFLSKRKFVLFALVAAMVLGLAGVASADTVSFLGAVEGQWGDTSAWYNIDNPNNHVRLGRAPNDDEDAIIPAGVNITINAAATAKTITFNAPAVGAPDPGETTLTLNDKLTVGEGNETSATTLIRVKHDTAIAGNSSGKVEFLLDTATEAKIDVDEDKEFQLGVVLGEGSSITTITKTGKGALVLSGGTADGIIAISHVETGRLVVKDKIPTGVTIGLAPNTVSGNVLDLDGTLELKTANTSIIPDSTGNSDKSVINILGNVTLGTGAIGTRAFEGEVNVSGTLKYAARQSQLEDATINVAENGTLDISATGVVIASLNADGDVKLNIGPTDDFTLTGSSIISGDIEGYGVLQLNATLATDVFKLRGDNSYTETLIGGSAAGTVEILNEKSLGQGDVTFATTDWQTLKVADDAGNFNLENDLIVRAEANIEVPDGVELTLLNGGIATNNGAITKIGDGTVVLDGYIAAGTGGFVVDRGMLVLRNDDAAKANPIEVNANGTLKPGHNGIRHAGDLTLNAQSTLKTLTEANADGPMLYVDGALTAPATGSSFKVVTEYKGGTWTMDKKLQVLSYLKTAAHNVTTTSARAFDAKGNRLDTNGTIDDSGALYATLLIAPSKDYVYPTIGAKTVTVAADTFKIEVPVTSLSGLASAEAKFLKAELADINLTETIGAFGADGVGSVTISGTTPETDGTYYIKLTATASSNTTATGYASESEDGAIKLIVDTDGGEQTPEPKVTGSATLDLAAQKFSVSSLKYTFGGEAQAATGSYVVYADDTAIIPATTVTFGADGTASDIEIKESDVTAVEGFEFKTDTKYELRVTVDGKTFSFSDEEESEKEPGNGGGGCDAGFGLFGLLAATGAVALLRRKG
jgi:hypothetical protein